MRHIHAGLLASAWLLLASCSPPPEECLPADQSPEHTVKSFLLRFKGYHQRHPSFAWTTGGYPDPNPNSYYVLNEATVAAYIDSVAACGAVSATYLNGLKRHFRQIGEELARTKQREDAILSQGYDPVIFDQDLYDYYDTVDTARVVLKHSTPQRRRYLVHTGVPLLVTVVAAPTGWQIDSIRSVRLEEVE
ncbi:hypothetical protein [Hymenobacter arizonensis]|uniref:DUF3828 domain-containing protein n=1 Tax=Hymenobacter arizonensis TaxID=1227077 RepID=A0A1I6BN44_HYMAR|nr:hypothetical protein [Hymenobacter arizonensis]SFQ82352.1 hypothetical protein SAMN04515668_4792 [Hymenobacter arizonensis]